MGYPFVSIIIPVRNEEKYIRECLESIEAQTYPKEKMEILVVDGMSGDRTREIVEKFKIDNQKLKIQLLDNQKGHRANGLNIGIKAAKGDIVIRIDARTRISEDYVEKCVKTLLEKEADNVGGVQVPFITANTGLIQKAIGLAATHIFGAGDAPFRLGKKSGEVESVYLGCFRKSIFDRIGLFDEEAPIISEDSDINYRIRKAGGKVYLNKDIKAYYIPRDNLKDLWRLYFRYGGARAGFFLKHRALRWRQLAPIFFVLSFVALPFLLTINSIIYSISIINYIILFLLAILVGLYLVADIFASAFITRQEKNVRLFLPLMIVFSCMHFAWALGFMWRMFQRPKPGKYWGY
jgi:glycosyltransferase involved in cell wall biosynthesis